MKSAVEKSDEGWYRCRACIYKGTDLQACDVNNAKFYLKVIKPRNKAVDDPLGQYEEGPTGGSSSTSPVSEGDVERLLIEFDSPQSICQVCIRFQQMYIIVVSINFTVFKTLGIVLRSLISKFNLVVWLIIWFW